MPTRFKLGDTVYLCVHMDRFPGMVTGIILPARVRTPPAVLLTERQVIRPQTPAYYVTWANLTETAHFEIELTGEFEKTYS